MYIRCVLYECATGKRPGADLTDTIMTIKEAENFITAAAQCGIEFHEAAILIQEKIINSGQQKFTSEQWGEMLQLWECETALAEED